MLARNNARSPSVYGQKLGDERDVAVSMPCYIAEGAGRQKLAQYSTSTGRFRRSIAKGLKNRYMAP